MPALSARFDPDSTAGNRDALDIRTRLLISLVVTSVTLYLSSNATLAAMSALTFVYLLQTKRYVVIVVAYLLMLLMTLLSLGIIYGSSRLFLWLLPGEGMSRMMSGVLDNFHTPFLRSIPSMNVLLAIGLNFSVQGFVGTMKSVRLPRFLFLPLLVFCRFVPEFVDVIRQMRDAVRMRGFSVGFGSAILHPFQTIRLTVIPLIVRTLRMADNLSIAAEMKRVGYAKKPTQLRTLRFRGLDFAVLAVTVILSAALCVWEASIPKPKRMPRKPVRTETRASGTLAPTGIGQADMYGIDARQQAKPHGRDARQQVRSHGRDARPARPKNEGASK